MSRSTTAPAHPLPGDRAPDFWLPHPEGQFGRFYDRFQGNPALLLFYRTAEAPSAKAALEALKARSAVWQAAGAKAVAVTRDSVEINAALQPALDLPLTLFSDPEGAITRGYGADRLEDGLLCLLLDSNQRVLSAFAGSGSVVDRALDALAEADPLSDEDQAPVLLIPRVLSPQDCRELIADWRADHAEGAIRARSTASEDAASRVVDHASKKRLDHRPGDARNQALTEVVMRRVAPELMKCYQFETEALERFCIAAYDAGRGDYFRPHRDNSTPQTATRRFALTLNLNEDYEGGGLRFPEFGGRLYSTAAGGAVLFSCSLLHEALPVTRGQRFVALTFLYGKGDVQRKGQSGLPPGFRQG